MLNVHEIIITEITTLLDCTNEVQVKNVNRCESATVLKAVVGLLFLGEVGVGKKSGKHLWICTKANARLDKAIVKLDALYDEDEVLTAVKNDLEHGGEGSLLPDGFTPPEAWAAEGGEGVPDPGEAPETAPEKRETAGELRSRYVKGVQAGEIGRAWLDAELKAENEHEKTRAGVVKFLESKLKGLDKLVAQETERSKKAEIKAKADKVKAEEKDKEKKEKAETRAVAKAARRAEKEANSQFAGVFVLPTVGDEIDLEADRECPNCKETKPVGDGFGILPFASVISALI